MDIESYLLKFKIPHVNCIDIDKAPEFKSSREIDIYFTGIARGANQAIDHILADLDKNSE